MTRAGHVQDPIYGYTIALIDELVRSGVRNFCVCPGSRSTPLALAIAHHAGARLWMHLDERSCSFFALGMAKASCEPVALLCSSGTAAANFYPAVVEASYARVPLIVLTADRPHELRENGAPQTIDQLRLYGPHVRWFADLPEPAAAPALLLHARAVACRAVAMARRGPAGPVHLNCPFREPFMPLPGASWAPDGGRAEGAPYVAVEAGARAPAPSPVAALGAELRTARRGLIICGPEDAPLPAAAIALLAERLRYPVLADPLSGVRCGARGDAAVLDCYDAFLRDPAFVDEFAPELVLRFGAMPTSKPLLQFLERHGGCRQIVVDGDGGWNEPTSLAAAMLHVDAGLLCEALLDELDEQPAEAGWLAGWQTADRAARRAITERFAGLDELFEGKVFPELAALLPDGALLYAGNSMPVRDLDTFFAGGGQQIRFLANRGANGIDGVVSSALGAAAVARPAVLVIGDISFYHDANGLLAARRHGLDLTIVLLNNDGGGIFSFLPQAAEPEHFETLFGTPHGLDFRPLAETYGARFTRVSDWQEFRAAVASGIGMGGLHVVEVPTERQRNVELHRELWGCVSEALKHALFSGAAA